MNVALRLLSLCSAECGSLLSPNADPDDVDIDVEAADDTDMEAKDDIEVNLCLRTFVFVADPANFRDARIVCSTTRKTGPHFPSTDLGESTPSC